ncbi:hypothetical protein F5Y14DRAFT_130699 [Nemania sp. NC0429]|nr:hypothetical protein F5Y14DRAFT_130699 [Nemania sp. NC0429]
MCTCNAFNFRHCRHAHAKFEPVSVCLTARLGLRAKCQERIVNGNPNRVRDFPVVDEFCNICYPARSRAESEEKKRKAREQRQMERDMSSINYLVAFFSPCFAFFAAPDFELQY